MDNNHIDRISITPTVSRQTPKNDFGTVLNASVNGVLRTGALVGSLTGMPIVSSAVSAVSSLVNGQNTVTSSAAATGSINLGTAGGAAGGIHTTSGGITNVTGVGSTVGTGGLTRSTASSGVEPAGMNDMLSGMRAEADRSMMVQMQMQNESREYNTLTNILKLRHDSAKAAINNIR